MKQAFCGRLHVASLSHAAGHVDNRLWCVHEGRIGINRRMMDMVLVGMKPIRPAPTRAV